MHKIVGSIKAKNTFTSLKIEIENIGYEAIKIANIELYKGLDNKYYGYNQFLSGLRICRR